MVHWSCGHVASIGVMEEGGILGEGVPPSTCIYPYENGHTGIPLYPLREYDMSGWRSGPRYQVWKRQVHEMWGYRCHLCGHPGAYDADHLTPLAVWPNQPYDPTLARPAHGIHGCPTCGVKCNQSRGAKLLDGNQYEPQLKW